MCVAGDWCFVLLRGMVLVFPPVAMRAVNGKGLAYPCSALQHTFAF